MTRARVRGMGTVVALLLAACAGPADRDQLLQVPDRARFALVSGALGTHCGSLDCHGQVGRNLRLYSQAGLRLDAYPSLEIPVSDAEVLADYQSVVALEPEQLALVVRDHGADPERLTLVRKARGREHHKGGTAVVVGDAVDRCLVSWLAGDVDDAACTDGAMLPVRPDIEFP